MPEPDKLPEEDSKSHRKKEMLALQKLGETLVSLTVEQTAKIPLDTTLADAIAEARNLKSHEAKRRQFQYIGKLMRRDDVAPIEAAVAQIQLKNQYSKAKFHQLERWRDQLITDDDPNIVQNFVIKYPDADIQRLRQLIRNAKKERATKKPPGAETALFRYLRDLIED